MFDEFKGLGTLDYSPSSQNSHGVLANAVTMNALVLIMLVGSVLKSKSLGAVLRVAEAFGTVIT